MWVCARTDVATDAVSARTNGTTRRGDEIMVTLQRAGGSFAGVVVKSGSANIPRPPTRCERRTLELAAAYVTPPADRSGATP